MNTCVLVLFLVDITFNLSSEPDYIVFFEFFGNMLICLFFMANFWFNVVFVLYYHQNYNRKILFQLGVSIFVLLKVFSGIFKETGNFTELRIDSCLNADLKSSFILFGIRFIDLMIAFLIIKIDKNS